MQVTIDGIELYDAVHWTVHIVHSETVAIIRCNIWGDQLIPNSGGIVIDGSRRVYLGENIISTADNAITVKTSSGEARSALKQASLDCSGLSLFLYGAQHQCMWQPSSRAAMLHKPHQLGIDLVDRKILLHCCACKPQQCAFAGKVTC